MPPNKPDINKPDINQPDTKTIKYNTLWFGLGITVLCLIVLFVVDKSNGLKIELHNYLELFSCGAVTTGLIYTAIALQYNYISHTERLAFDKQTNDRKEEREDNVLKTKKIELTFEISSLWFKGDMAENVERTRTFLHTYKITPLNNPSHLQDFIEYLDKNRTERKSLVSILNFFENISLLLDKDVIDEECIQDSFKAVFISYYCILMPYIAIVQSDNPRYYKSFVKVVTKWM